MQGDEKKTGGGPEGEAEQPGRGPANGQYNYEGYDEAAAAVDLDDESGEGYYPEVAEAPAESGASAMARRAAAAAAVIKARKEREEREELQEQQKKLNLVATIQRLDVGEKAKLARNGDKDARAILIKDGNKQVALAVLGNPKITAQEIEMIAASRNVSEEILREVAGNKDWVKGYTVMLALVNNPKTPVGISLTYLPKLKTRDLRSLAKSKGIPEAVRITAKKHAEKRSF